MIDLESLLEKSSTEIFSTYNLSQIQQISDKLSNVSKSKHQELRSLVSSKYRDLLKTGDDIIAIKELGVNQDHSLYDLSFFRSPKLDKISTIDRNFKILNQQICNNDGINVQSLLGANTDSIDSVLLNSDFWIHISPLLEVSVTSNLDDILQILVEFNTFKNNSKYSQLLKKNKPIIQNKLKEISKQILGKLKDNTPRTAELFSVYHKIETNNLSDLEELHIEDIDLEIFNNLITILEEADNRDSTLQQHIKPDNSNIEIFTDFPKFNRKFQSYLTMKLKDLQTELTTTVTAYSPNSYINLYDLQFQDPLSGSVFHKDQYLLDIYYLSIGVENKALVDIIEKLTRFKHFLGKYFTFFNDSEDTETFNIVFEDLIKLLKTKTDVKDNLVLIKHLDGMLNFN